MKILHRLCKPCGRPCPPPPLPSAVCPLGDSQQCLVCWGTPSCLRILLETNSWKYIWGHFLGIWGGRNRLDHVVGLLALFRRCAANPVTWFCREASRWEAPSANRCLNLPAGPAGQKSAAHPPSRCYNCPGDGKFAVAACPPWDGVEGPSWTLCSLSPGTPCSPAHPTF